MSSYTDRQTDRQTDSVAMAICIEMS